MSEVIASEIVRLQSGGIEALVNTSGAWVEGLKVNTGTETIDLFAPKHVNDLGQNRGGMHVCLPNFDPATPELELAQHGFGRVLPWEIMSFDGGSVEMVLDTNRHKAEVPKHYHGLLAELVYSTAQTNQGLFMFSAKLTMTNKGIDVMPWAVGFHPYFATNGEKSSRIILDTSEGKQQIFDKSSLFISQMHDHPSRTTQFVMGGFGVELRSKQLQKLVVWTDSPDEYICVEPTGYGGILGSSDKRLWPTYPPGGAYNYDLDIGFRLPDNE